MSRSLEVEIKRKELPGRYTAIAWVVTLAGAALVLAGFYADPTRASFGNIIVFMLLASVGVGSIFLVALEYVAGAVWSTPIRRVSEHFAFLTPVVALLAIPMFFNMHDLFHWTHTSEVAGDPALQGKSPYLNTTFFAVRFAVTFLIWTFFCLVLTRNSRKQDTTGNQNLTRSNIWISAVFLPVFAVTITFFAIDWVMSLEPHWFSTIFGVYYFSGTVLAALAAATLAVILLHQSGYFARLLRPDHFYSLGALLFAFVNFWAYIAFSQYLLIWYANLPEETFWMIRRWKGGWEFLSLGLMLVHFLVPYAGLLSQQAKMNPRRLKIMAIWILFAHYVDLYWLVMPSRYETFVFGWIDFGFPVLGVGIALLLFARRFHSGNLIPVGDPKLGRGLAFRL